MLEKLFIVIESAHMKQSKRERGDGSEREGDKGKEGEYNAHMYIYTFCIKILKNPPSTHPQRYTKVYKQADWKSLALN